MIWNRYDGELFLIDTGHGDPIKDSNDGRIWYAQTEGGTDTTASFTLFMLD